MTRRLCRLSWPGARRISRAMQSKIILAVAVAALPSLAFAQARTGTHAPAHSAHPASKSPNHKSSVPKSSGPQSIGKFGDWQGATHQEAGQQVCYAFTRAYSSQPSLPKRGDVVLTVTQRPGGRDAVAISAGFAYAAGAEAQMGVDQAQLAFYTADQSAFARDGRAAVTAFEKGRQAVAKSPGPRNVTISDTFSLRGFSLAYAAINKACPVK